jgi:hypothetical protein
VNVTTARLLAAGLSAGALVAPSAAAAARVHVRVEGARAGQLDVTVATNPQRTIGLGTHPTCSGGSALGALDAATRGSWGGSYFTGLGYSPERILRETHTFASGTYYAFYVNDRPSSAGVCAYRPRSGDDLLFGLADAKAGGFPKVIALRLPKRVRAGRAFAVKVVAYPAKGPAAPLAGATVTASGHRARTNRAGRVRLTAVQPGRVTVRAVKRGYIRSAVTSLRIARAGS